MPKANRSWGVPPEVDGVRRPVYEQLDGRQYVIGYDGE